jgi:branched-chain amino acid transport system substrate-binding protein
MKRPSIFTIVAVAIAILFMFGMGNAADTIKLGAAYSMTGRIGWIGEDAVNGVKLIVDEVNANGGINGKKIELVVYDTKTNPDTARTVFEKLIKKDKVVAICGPVITQSTQTVLPIAEKYKIPYGAMSGGIQINAVILPKYKNEGKKCYTWAMSIGTPRQNEVKVLWLKKNGYKKIGNIEPLSQMGDLSTLMYKQWAKKYGLEVVATEKFDNKGADFTAQMSKLKAAGADCIGTMASGAPASILVKNRDQVGMKNVPMMTSDANLSKKFIKLLEGNFANVYTVGAISNYVQHLPDSHPQKKIANDFAKRFEAKFGKKPRSMFFAPAGYDTALMCINAIKAVGTDGEAIRDYVESHPLQGVQAYYTFSDLDHRGIGVDQASVMKIAQDDWVPAF